MRRPDRFLFGLLLVPLLLLLASLQSGCRSKPMRVCMDGDMNMNGDMNMAGSMNMTGDLGMSGDLTTSMRTDNRASRLATVTIGRGATGCGKVAIVDVDGLLLNRNIGGFGSMGENPVALFREKLDALEADPGVAAIVLRINSPGGGVTACDIMTRDLRAFRERRGIPVVACLMDVGAGGAYLLASASDTVVAHPTTVVGGLGVILNSYNLQEAMGQFNVTARPVKAGKLVDAASPVRPLEPEELQMLQGMATEFHGRLKRQIHDGRPAVAVDADLFDGRVITGEGAAKAGLVDRIGYLDDALAEARGLAGIGADAAVVMLRRDNDRAYTAFDVTPNSPQQSALIPLNLPGLDRSQLPTFLYVWQPETSLAAAAGG
ncbi:MAG: proteinase yteI [Planctomycetota bacterium]